MTVWLRALSLSGRLKVTRAIPSSPSSYRRVEKDISKDSQIEHLWLMPNILALDQGTTGSTALVVAGNGAVLGRGYREIPQFFPAPGQVEHDANALFSSVIDAGRDALREANV